MTADTLTRLKGSIEKWEKIEAGTGRDGGTTNCPLCAKFLRPVLGSDRANCDGCPVKAATGNDSCTGSPYSNWIRIADPTNSSEAVLATTNQARAAAQSMTAFLRSLLPEKNGRAA